MSLVPKKVFFVKGIGHHKSKLGAFEQALRNAGIEKFNLVNVSSILPPHCIEINKEEGIKQLRIGQIIYTVLSRVDSNKLNQMISASIGVAKPSDKDQYGYLSEHHMYDAKLEEIGNYTEGLAAEMLATTLGIDFNPEADYDEKREVFKMGGKIVETKHITEYATVRNEDEWASVVVAAVFIL
jgi:arginine decarboxylase